MRRILRRRSYNEFYYRYSTTWTLDARRAAGALISFMCDRFFRLYRIHLFQVSARTATRSRIIVITLPIHVVRMQDKLSPMLSPHIRGSTRCTPQPLRGALALTPHMHMHMHMDMDMHNLFEHTPLSTVLQRIQLKSSRAANSKTRLATVCAPQLDHPILALLEDDSLRGRASLAAPPTLGLAQRVAYLTAPSTGCVEQRAHAACPPRRRAHSRGGDGAE